MNADRPAGPCGPDDAPHRADRMSGRPGDSPGAFDDLEAGLRALGQALHADVPPPPDVARAVRARLEAEPRRHGRRFLRRSPDSPRALWPPRPSPRRIVVAVAVVLAALTVATPQGRAAVTAVLRFAGVEIGIGGPVPSPTVARSPALPGEQRVSLDEARRIARFPVIVPDILGEPPDVRVADGGRVVTLRWPGLRLDEFDGTLGVVWRKELGEPWPERIDAVNGWWIRRPHGFYYVPQQGGAQREQQVAGPTLIWQRGRVGLRLEGADRDRALRIAAATR